MPLVTMEQEINMLAVRQLKWYASWVQTDVSQVGPYLPQALNLEEICL